jgi:hypothetical protein
MFLGTAGKRGGRPKGSKNKKKLAETLQVGEAVSEADDEEVDPFEEAAELMDETVNTA